MTLTDEDRSLLLRLLATPTAGPLEVGEAGPPPRLWEAQRDYAHAAERIGFRVVRHAPAEPADLAAPGVPATVRAAAADPDFLTCQPSLVLRLGPDTVPHERTVMFNVHLDTVAGGPPVSFDGEVFHGRGAIDAKGSAVALLAAVRSARERSTSLGRDSAVIVQAVAGEEGGAMGVLGTRPLVERGHIGRLNVFCEPTSGRFLTRCTASMTARVSVRGDDAIDDRPHAGHNASVLLGFLAQRMGRALDGHARDGAVCVAGLHTGTLHNRVYGTGDLLLNLSYADAGSGRTLEAAVTGALDTALTEFADSFADTALFARTATDARRLTRLDWPKRGLPVLDDRDRWGHDLLRRAGVPDWPADEPAFTCDAIWMAGIPDTCTVVLGPGDLAADGAHGDDERARLSDLDGFADTVARLLTSFTDETNGHQ
ncbi:M20/M25/M40 family metallo-hydrolase [Nocardiopsis lambiniae]|uniref:M20/M25/M40 family metallo-hydrolase n=1 Tax=Nocardiopsis lambiniae TaxID=3075539 RepID=A0ABU2M6N6_9ACTN|nr:M20/M25/M40 family metallo-hydrolase [Nocardiopsis sp. DSM 44743]MDT0328334.1 M20/M25/M40 family metallo-hydrolase [Nocardiopsis sp. DSM 44743]